MCKVTKEDALFYHSRCRQGKVEIIPAKPYFMQIDLSLAYTPGIAYPCLEIEKNPEDAYKYTTKDYETCRDQRTSEHIRKIGLISAL